MASDVLKEAVEPMESTTTLPRMLTVQEVARTLRYSEKLVRELAQRGVLNATRTGPRGRMRFQEEDVRRFIASGGTP